VDPTTFVGGFAITLCGFWKLLAHYRRSQLRFELLAQYRRSQLRF
jgi:hypothetical protein